MVYLVQPVSDHPMLQFVYYWYVQIGSMLIIGCMVLAPWLEILLMCLELGSIYFATWATMALETLLMYLEIGSIYFAMWATMALWQLEHWGYCAWLHICHNAWRMYWWVKVWKFRLEVWADSAWHYIHVGAWSMYWWVASSVPASFAFQHAQ